MLSRRVYAFMGVGVNMANAISRQYINPVLLRMVYAFIVTLRESNINIELLLFPEGFKPFRRIVNCLIAPLRNILTYLLTCLLYFNPGTLSMSIKENYRSAVN